MIAADSQSRRGSSSTGHSGRDPTARSMVSAVNARGGMLDVRLKGDEPHRNVSRSVRALGHEIVADTPQPDGSVVLSIRKKNDQHA